MQAMAIAVLEAALCRALDPVPLPIGLYRRETRRALRLLGTVSGPPPPCPSWLLQAYRAARRSVNFLLAGKFPLKWRGADPDYPVLTARFPSEPVRGAYRTLTFRCPTSPRNCRGAHHSIPCLNPQCDIWERSESCLTFPYPSGPRQGASLTYAGPLEPHHAVPNPRPARGQTTPRLTSPSPDLAGLGANHSSTLLRHNPPRRTGAGSPPDLRLPPHSQPMTNRAQPFPDQTGGRAAG